MSVFDLFHDMAKFLNHHPLARKEWKNHSKSFLLPSKLNFDISHSIH